MPKIEAPTVAEHHAQRRAALLAAATDLIAANGLDALTLAAVGSAAGLARSSVYQYFDSTPALLAALVEDVMPRAAEELAAIVAHSATPADRIDAFVTAVLDTATDPLHRSLAALHNAALPPQCRSRLAELHELQYAPLRSALVELQVAQPDVTLRLLLGLCSGAAHAVADGATRRDVLERTLALVHHGLGSQN